MSIIYDALKKVETKIADSGIKPEVLDLPKKSPSKLKSYLFYLLILGAGFIIAGTIFILSNPQKKPLAMLNKIAKPAAGLKKITTAVSEKLKLPTLAKEPPTTPISSALSEESASGSPPILVLNGVFFSENEGYALINNQIVREGDVINGATVERINLQGVELKSEGSVIQLSTVK